MNIFNLKKKKNTHKSTKCTGHCTVQIHSDNFFFFKTLLFHTRVGFKAQIKPLLTHPQHLRSKAVLSESNNEHSNINLGNVIQECNGYADSLTVSTNQIECNTVDNLPF